MPDTTTEPPIPKDAGLKSGRQGDAESRRSADDLIDAAAAGHALAPEESDDLVAYFLSNDALPGEATVIDISVDVGYGDDSRTFRCSVRPIEWSELQDANERATDSATGDFDAYVGASWQVARTLITPKLGPIVARLQKENPETAPDNAAALLRRMFRRSPGSLLEIAQKILRISRLQNGGSAAVKEIEAAKNSS